MQPAVIDSNVVVAALELIGKVDPSLTLTSLLEDRSNVPKTSMNLRQTGFKCF
jgi:hypothetical protein